jgi:hypothetical protein
VHFAALQEPHLDGISEGALCVFELGRAEAQARVLVLLEVLQLKQVGMKAAAAAAGASAAMLLSFCCAAV